MKYFAGIDIGATKIIFVLLADNKVVQKKKIFTPKDKKALLRSLEENIIGLSFKAGPLAGVGIGVPAFLDFKKHLILDPPNLPCLKNCFLTKIVKSFLPKQTRVAMDNDANCFALSEAVLGAGRDAGIVFGVTLGSGIGGGIILNQRIYRGAYGAGGEVGHMSIKFDGYKCSCGSFGCFEEYASDKFFKRKKINVKELSLTAAKGDKRSLQFFSDYGRYLGIGFANIVNVLDPEVIVVGGGISRASKFFVPAAQKELKKRVVSPLSKKYVKIKIAKLGESSGAIGAALLLINK